MKSLKKLISDGKIRPRSKESRLFQKIRNDMIWIMRSNGLTLQEIGNHFGIGREPVRQILARRERDIKFHEDRQNYKKLFDLEGWNLDPRIKVVTYDLILKSKKYAL